MEVGVFVATYAGDVIKGKGIWRSKGETGGKQGRSWLFKPARG